ncbi:hypothetical protein Tco_1276222 [Tanacetum coccineum]
MPYSSPSFKLLDEIQVVLKTPRQNGVYSLDLKNIVPSGEVQRTWDVLAVSVQYLQSNPSPLFALYTISPFMGCFGLCDFARGEVIGAMGCGKWVMRLSCAQYLGGVWALNREGRVVWFCAKCGLSTGQLAGC